MSHIFIIIAVEIISDYDCLFIYFVGVNVSTFVIILTFFSVPRDPLIFTDFLTS